MLKLKYVFAGFVLFACYPSYMGMSLLNERGQKKNSKVPHNDRNVVKESAEVADTLANAHFTPLHIRLPKQETL